MAPIPRIAAKPLSIITGALFTAFSAPSSSPPTNGLNATVWGTKYIGSASFLNLTLLKTPTSPSSSFSPSPSPSSSSLSDSPSTPVSSTFVYYNTKTDTYTGCNNKTFSASDSVVLMNPLQFGNPASKNSTCGEWVLVRNRKNTMQSTYAQVVGQCPTCDYGSVDVSLGALSDLAPDLPFESMVFDDSSDTTIDDLMGADTPQPANSTPISPKDLLSVVWELSGPPKHTGTNQIDLPSGTRPTSTTSPTPTSTTEAPKPTSPSSPVFSGRATWYSDTSGFCEHPYSQSDMIVAVNEAQMGRVKDLCGKKILLTKEGSDVQVVVEVVDMCPSKYCKSGDLDLSQAAFKEFADLDVGELTLKWSFLDS